MTLDNLCSRINTRINYVKNNTENAFITKSLGTIGIKLDMFKAKSYKEQETVNYACDRIINYDIRNMKGVQGLTNMVYKKMDEMAEFFEMMKTVYFEEDIDPTDDESDTDIEIEGVIETKAETIDIPSNRYGL